MKRKVIMRTVCACVGFTALLFFTTFLIVPVRAGEYDEFQAVVASRDGTGSYTVGGVRDLYSFGGEAEYQLLTLQPSGSMVITKERNKVLEYTFRGTVLLPAETVYYAGLGGYYTRQNDEFINISDSKIRLSLSQGLEVDSELLSFDINYGVSLSNDLVWETITVQEEYFSGLTNIPYNRDDTCGSVAACVLLGYYDEFINDNIITNQAYRDGNGTSELLHQLMISYIEPDLNGFSNQDVTSGLTEYFEENTPACLQATPIYIGSSVHVNIQSYISDDEPLIIDIKRRLGARDNHALIIYGYRVISGGKLEYLVNYCWANNTDNNAVWITSDFVNSAVFLRIRADRHNIGIISKSKHSHVTGCTYCRASASSESHKFVIASPASFVCSVCGYVTFDPSVFPYRGKFLQAGSLA